MTGKQEIRKSKEFQKRLESVLEDSKKTGVSGWWTVQVQDALSELRDDIVLREQEQRLDAVWAKRAQAQSARPERSSGAPTKRASAVKTYPVVRPDGKIVRCTVPED